MTNTSPPYRPDLLKPRSFGYYRDASAATADFAKEILTALITLVASVSSFYFGAGIVKTAQAGGSGPPQPSIGSVDPGSGDAGQTVLLKVSGTGLDLVNKVSIISGKKEVQATDVTSNPSLIKCTLSLPPDIAVGKWSVVANTTDRKSATLNDGFTINAAGEARQQSTAEQRPEIQPPQAQPPEAR